MRNKIGVIILLIFGAFSCTHKGYKIEGVLAGAPDSVKVSLMDLAAWPNKVMDSTYVVDGRFIFNGQVLKTTYVKLVIDPIPRQIANFKDGMKAKDFFLDNGKIKFECIYDSLPSMYYEPRDKRHNVKIIGSASNDLYEDFLAKDKLIRNKSEELWREYLKIYHIPALSGIFNTQEGVKIARERHKCTKILVNSQKEFIKTNPSSIVSIYVAKRLLVDLNHLTMGDVDEIMGIFDPLLQNTQDMKSLQEMLSTRKNFLLGEKYKSLELENLVGERVQLSNYIQEGKYTMLEFWASWCGPCRGEIPHLKHVYEKCGDKLNMISISLDSNQQEWLKAVDEEKMAWMQLRGEKQARDYGVSGVPFCLVLDPSGKIMGSGLRGAGLDVLLMDLGLL